MVTLCLDALGMHTPTIAFKLAAIVLDEDDQSGDAADTLIRTHCLALQRRGYRVRGLLQQRRGSQDCRSVMQLLDVHEGRLFVISQALGKLSASCCLDTDGVAQASSVLRDALYQEPDLVLINRFGKLEAQGEGFAQELADFVAQDVPVLTVLAHQYLPAWRDFTDAQGQELPVCEQALRGWLERYVLYA